MKQWESERYISFKKGCYTYLKKVIFYEKILPCQVENPLFKKDEWKNDIYTRLLFYCAIMEAKGMEARAGIFKPLWSPGIDAKASIPPAYVAWRAGMITLFLLGA